MLALGEEFRRAREARGLSTSEVAEQIHIRSLYLDAIESEDWPAIGEPVYVRGFLRTYARFIGVDPEAAVARFNAATGAKSRSPETMGGPRPQEPANASPLVVVASAVAVLLVLFVVYNAIEARRSDQPRVAVASQATVTPVPTVTPFRTAAPAAVISTPEATTTPAATAVATSASTASPTPTATAKSASPAPTASTTASATPSASATPAASARPSPRGASPSPASGTPGPIAGRHSFDVQFAHASWVRITADGKPVVEGTFPIGTDRKFSAANLKVYAGNAGGVLVSMDGRELGAVGNLGDVVERSFPEGTPQPKASTGH